MLNQRITRDGFQKLDDKVSSTDKSNEGNNWRQYFRENELENAYQHVEVEKEEDPLENFSDGSSSNPSQDNFDLQDIYE